MFEGQRLTDLSDVQRSAARTAGGHDPTRVGSEMVACRREKEEEEEEEESRFTRMKTSAIQGQDEDVGYTRAG